MKTGMSYGLVVSIISLAFLVGGCRPAIVGEASEETGGEPASPVTLVPGNLTLVKTIYGDGAGTVPDNSALTGEASVAAAGMGDNDYVAASPDGLSLYTTSMGYNIVTGITIDPVSNAVTVQHLSPAEIPGFQFPMGVAVSPDGLYVYVADMDHVGGTRIVTLDRDTTTGAMSYSGTKNFDAVNMADVSLYANIAGGDLGFSAMAISPDGKNIYVGEYYWGHLITLDRNVADGTLSYTDGNAFEGYGPWTIGVSPDGRFVWTADDILHKLQVLNRDLTTGALSVNHVFGPSDVWEASGSPDGKFIFGADALGGKIDIHGLDANGDFAYLGEYAVAGQLEGGHSLAVSPDGKSLYASSYTNGALLIFDINSSTGAITLRQSFSASGSLGTAVAGLTGAGTLSVDKTGEYIFVTGRTSGATVKPTVLIFKQQFVAP